MIRIEKETNYNETDKKILNDLEQYPVDYWNFKNVDTSELVHGLHTYPAMMIYPISRTLLNIVKSYKNIDTLFDPFAGSGTVLVEGINANIKNIFGNDLNPLARLLTQVKTTLLNKNDLINDYEKLKNNIDNIYLKYFSYIHNIDSYITNEKELSLTDKDGWGSDAPKYLKEYFENNSISLEIPTFTNLGFWFRPRVIIELQIIKESILQIENEQNRNFFLIAFSEIIRLVSNRRNGEFKMYRMQVEKVEKFNPDVKKEFYKVLERNIEKEIQFIENNKEYDGNVFIANNNAKELEDIPDNSVDLIITSPPYGDSKTTVAYGEFSRLSLQWINLYDVDENQIKSIDRNLMGGTKPKECLTIINSNTFNDSYEKIFKVDEKRAKDVYSFYYDLEKIIEKLSQKMKKDGYQFWVVGNRTVKNENLKTDIIIREIAEKYGLDYLCTIDRNILNKVMPSRNSPTNQTGETSTTMVNEHIVLLKKL